MSNNKLEGPGAKQYLTLRRFASYNSQLEEVLGFNPGSVLEIGSHLGVVTRCMRVCGINVTTLDINPECNPDVVGSVLDIPLADNSQDIVLCCEVLEHIPYEDFPRALSEILRVCRKGAVISLPHYGRYYSVTFKLPHIEQLHLKIEIPYFFKNLHVYDGDHYWEIGKRGYPPERIVDEMQKAGFNLIRRYRVPFNSYHHVFVLSKNQPG